MRFKVVLFLSLFLAGGCSGDGRVTVQVGDARASVELALTADERSVGLMHRTRLGEDQGLLLVLPEPRVFRIWMLNTRIPLDVGFFDGEGRLLDYVSMEPDGGNRIHRSPGVALYALEMNKGWFAKHGIRPGDRLRLPRPVVGE